MTSDPVRSSDTGHSRTPSTSRASSTGAAGTIVQLRRLTRFSRIELEAERDELKRQIEELEAVLADEKLLHRTVSTELADVAKAHGTPRRTVLLESVLCFFVYDSLGSALVTTMIAVGLMARADLPDEVTA